MPHSNCVMINFFDLFFLFCFIIKQQQERERLSVVYPNKYQIYLCVICYPTYYRFNIIIIFINK